MLFVYGDLFVIVLSNDTRTQKIHEVYSKVVDEKRKGVS
jgi:hypothetical protein